MKKAFLRFLSILMIGFMFFSCANSTGGDSDDSNTQKQQQQNNSGKTSSGKTNSGTTNNGTNDSGTTDSGTTDSGTTDSGTTDDSDEQIDDTPAANRKIGVTFDFTGAQALAKLEAKQDGSRAVTNVDELGDLVKILADGSMENAITVDENCSLSDIVAIYKSPLEDSKDIFIVFTGESTLGYEEVEKEYEWGETYTDRTAICVGQLICLHEDGSIADILKKDNATDYWNTHMSLKTESVTFDADGNVYFISSDNGDMIYQYNPSTDELTKMVASVENTYYEKMQIDDEGQWIFVSGNRYTGSSSYFLRAIPINNPNSPVNIYFSSNNGISIDNWVYDNRNGKMYFIVDDGGKKGLFTVTKNGGFKDKAFYHGSVGDGFENKVFDFFYEIRKDFYWYSDYTTNDEFDSNKLVENLIYNSVYYYDYKTREEKRITRNDVDIRFDKYFSATDKLKALAVLTAGKKNEEAFEALNNPIGLAALFNYFDQGYDIDGNSWFEGGPNGYRHNFLADIMYIKNTDTLISESDDEIISYFDYAYDENGNYIYDENGYYQFVPKTIKGKDLFGRKTNGLYQSRGDYYFLDYSSWCETMAESTKTYGFKSAYNKEDGTIDSKLLFDYFCSYCNVEGTKEFRLTEFKDDGKFNSLYSSLKNEEAIEWIASDVERLNLFGQMLCCNDGNYSSFMSELSKICFIAGTDQKAITWNWESQNNENIFYGNWYGINCKLSASDTGIYYEYYYTWGENPFYYIVQVADADGKMVELVNKLPLPSGKVVKSEKNKDRIILQYSMMDENGSELGYHHIYSVEMANGLVTNCFDNVPNRNNLEVVSFNSAGDLLYYSAVRGTLVENGIVNLITNEYNPLTVQRKMVAVYTFN